MNTFAKWIEWKDQGKVNEFTRNWIGYLSEVTKRNKRNPGWAIWRAIEVNQFF